MRAFSAIIVTFLALAAFAGCGVKRQYRFTFHKEHVSQAQLLHDQASLRKVSGVIEVFSTAHSDGSGSIEVEVKDEKDIKIQELLTSMGYTRGQH